MTFQLPRALRTDDDKDALGLLGRYFGASGRAYVGAEFDTWDSSGTRADDVHRFTPDDLVTMAFLSVPIRGVAARALLRDRAEEFTSLLKQLKVDQDLVDVEEPLHDDWVGWQMMRALRSLDGVGATRGSKLLARKRPRLRPIYDSVVARVTHTKREQWEPVRVALRADDRALHQRLVHLHSEARLSSQVPPLRVLDVVAWMEGKDKGW
ncbi:MAG: DUF6308 family protein [Ornithinimicrobium sp.]